MSDIISPTSVDLGTRPLRLPTDREAAIVDTTIRTFHSMSAVRSTEGAHWEEIAELIDPPSRNTFFFGNYNYPGVKKTDRQVDSTGMLALNRFCAICISLLCPENSMWHQLEAEDPNVQKDRQVQLWMETTNRALFAQRKKATSNFVGQVYPGFRSLGAYGTRGMFIDRYYDPLQRERGMRHIDLPLGELYIGQNFQGQVNKVIRWYTLTAQQMYEAWPIHFPMVAEAALSSKSEERLFNILHHIEFRQDYDPQRPRYDVRSMPWTSYYVSLEGKCLLEEGGFNTFPVPVGRYVQTAGETYGRSPGMDVLPALKTLNSEKRTFLTQGHRAAAPVLLTHDDGLMSMDLRPNAINPGGLDAQGRMLVNILPSGQIQVTKEMMDEERALINDSFLVSLFQILTESPEMTATEVLERVSEKGILLAPTVGRQESEFESVQINRELDLMSQNGQIGPMPGLLREAGGATGIRFTSPLAMAMRAKEAAGFMRSVQMTQDFAQATGDMSRLDVYDFDTADRDIAQNINGVPASWMATDKAILAKRSARAKQAAITQQIQALPAQAAMMKAQSTVAKDQQNPPPPPGMAPEQMAA